MKFTKHSSSFKSDSDVATRIAQSLGYLVEPIQTVSRTGLVWNFSKLVRTLSGDHKPKIRIALVFADTRNYWEVAAVRSLMESLQNGYGDTHEMVYTVLSGENSITHFQDTVIAHLKKEHNQYDVCVAFTPWVARLLKDGIFLLEMLIQN